MKRVPMTSTSIQDAAANWFVRRRDGLTPEAEANFQAWLAADASHRAAIAELSKTWDRMSVLAIGKRQRDAAERLRRHHTAHRRRPYVLAAVSLAAAAALMLAVLPERPERVMAPDYNSVALRPNIEKLSDGSTIELNADAEIAVDISPTLRTVRLLKGEAHFAVAKDASRPFVVIAGKVAVRAVGTEFAVRLDASEVGVLVTEGRVAVEQVTAASSPGELATEEAPVLLEAGNGVLVAAELPAAAPLPVRPMPTDRIASALAWRGKRVEFTRMPLSAAANLFNRQNSIHLSIADEAIGALPISGIFWSDDPEAFARLLELGFGVRAERVANTIVLSQR